MSILFAVLALAGPVPDKSLADAIAIKARNLELRAKPEERGCIDSDAVTCLASLGLYVYISPEDAQTSLLPRPVEQDIHGNAIAQSISFLISFKPGPASPLDQANVPAEIYLADGLHVTRVTFHLPQPPLIARTASDWAATRIFELATSVLGEQCVGTDRLAFYRRYDAMQRQSASGTHLDNDYSDPGVSSSVSGRETICGVSIQAASVSGVSVSAGDYAGSMMTFSHAIPSKSQK